MMWRVFLLLLLPTYAYAHGPGDPLHGVQPFVDVSGALVGAGTSYGLVMRQGEGWAWTPEEALGAEPLVWHHDGARVWVGSYAGLHTTSDGGCSWTRVDRGLGQRAVRDLAQDARGRLWVATEYPSGDNGLWVRPALGEDFAPTSLSGPDLLARSVVVAGEALWVQGTDRTDGRQVLWRSRDAGGSFEEVVLGDDVREVVLLGVREGTPDVGVERMGVWSMWRGGVFEPLPGRPLGVTASGVVVTEAGAVGPGAEAWEGALCVTLALGWACVDTTRAAGNFRAPDGTSHLLWSEIAPAACPEGTVGAREVARWWPTLQSLGLGARPADVEEESEGCACGQVGGRAPMSLLWIVLGWCLLVMRSWWRRVGWRGGRDGVGVV